MIDDTCINHESGDRDANAGARSSAGESTQHGALKKELQSQGKKKKTSQHRVWYQSGILPPKLEEEEEVWSCWDDGASGC